MAALVRARLTKFTSDALTNLKPETWFWCDSTITLAWINSSPSKWKPFVCNRVREIQSLMDPKKWSHCPGTQNPADLLTRRTMVNNISHSDLWHKGPEWLASTQLQCSPDTHQAYDEESDAIYETGEEEQRCTKSVAVHLVPEKASPLLEIERISWLQRLLCIIAWIRRFTWICRNAASDRKGGPLDTSELHEAEEYWIKQAQHDAYFEEIDQLRENKKPSNQSKTHVLRLRLDAKGFLRLEGRLHFASEAEGTKHPILLPKEHPLTKLIVRAAHHRVLHGGVQDTLTEIRETF
ncbi:uncharacterized protein LOC135366362 [Ornithodoros turicata]|uniref:uncharacterized protein LOC135366362 n=1 Tax=Ornithodoros turicata TaxID=34597 RepID=UPI0031389543